MSELPDSVIATVPLHALELVLGTRSPLQLHDTFVLLSAAQPADMLMGCLLELCRCRHFEWIYTRIPEQIQTYLLGTGVAL